MMPDIVDDDPKAHKYQKYQDWIARLEAQKASLGRYRQQINRIFIAGLVVSPVGFIHSYWAVRGWIFAMTSLWAVGHYILFMHHVEDAFRIEQTKIDAQRVAEAEAAPHADPHPDRTKFNDLRNPRVQILRFPWERELEANTRYK